jgi:hypothetical protein
MDPNNAPPVPTDIIDARNCSYTELGFDVQSLGRYMLCDHKELADRFAYVRPRNNAIVVCDLLLGTER